MEIGCGKIVNNNQLSGDKETSNNTLLPENQLPDFEPLISMTPKERIQELRQLIETLKSQLPKHSIPASMLIQIEDWEEELGRLEEKEKAT